MTGRRILLLSAIFKLGFYLACCLGLTLTATPAHAAEHKTELLILCYHDIPQKVNLDKYGVDQVSFVQQLEYLRNHGYHFVGINDILQANKGEKALPEKAVLLTFDDAYESFYSFVFPLLKLYNYPSVLSVVTSWIDSPPSGIPSTLMSWTQISEVAKSGLVEVASHTHDLHKAIPYNPFGNTGWAAMSMMYDPAGKKYESTEAFQKRIADDITRSINTLKAKAGVEVKVLTWPYGKWNKLGMEAAQKFGIQVFFDIADIVGDVNSLYPLPRVMIINNPSIQEFIKELKLGFQAPLRKRIVQIDLDTIYDEDAQQMERNLDALIDRLSKMKVSTVYLQAFCDTQGTGNISSVYFPNRVLPMKADIFNRVVNQLAIRDIEVYAWMPMLSIVLPDPAENEALRVREWNDDGIRLSTSWYKRLTPFSEQTAEKLRVLYEDMAFNARIDGVVFLDDGYLSEFEDFHPAAMEVYKKIVGNTTTAPWELESDVFDRWTEAKVNALNTLTEKLMDTVRIFRPRAQFSRTLYTLPVTNNQNGRTYFSQDYEKSLTLYDCVNIMVYPLMEEKPEPAAWLRQIVHKVKTHKNGMRKTVFKLQAYDWNNKRWIDTRQLEQWMRIVVSQGAEHIGYYPDDCIRNLPQQELIRTMMSIEDFPFDRSVQENGLY